MRNNGNVPEKHDLPVESGTVDAHWAGIYQNAPVITDYSLIVRIAHDTTGA